MERLKLADMLEWYERPRRKPLVVWGARQVGKTYLVRHLFAEGRFDDCVYIDLKKDGDARNFLSTTSDPERYLAYIEARFGKRVSNDCPLIFDEVQQCHQVLSSLKYFKQDHRELPVIATGSMVRLSLRHGEGRRDADEFLFPVGAINSIDLYPLTFDEYLLNSNPVLLDRIRSAYHERRPLDRYEHDLALTALYEFLSIGGLPEVASTFLETRSYVEAREALEEVYSNYLADMDTYGVSATSILRTRRVYQNIFPQLNKENRNFKVSQVERGKSNRDYLNAYQWLELARVVYRSRKKQGRVPLPLTEEDEGLFRLYLSDAGMFTYQSGIPQSDFMARDKRNSLAGVFYESYVADELVARGIPLFFWTGKRSHEFEFVVSNGGLAVPIDVKRGSGRLGSLDEFRTCNPHSVAVKVHAGNLGYDAERDILSVPLYAVFALAEDLADGRGIAWRS